jgi:hypothetical protein
MPTVRIYLPGTVSLLAAHLATDSPKAWPAGPAYAVTPALVEWYAEGDMEELEYAAMTLAAQASLALLADDARAPRRRVVVAADVPDSDLLVAIDPSREQRGRVDVRRPVPLTAVAAVHVDDGQAERDVASAALSLDDDFAVGAAADHELLWYATQEIDQVVAGTSG